MLLHSATAFDEDLSESSEGSLDMDDEFDILEMVSSPKKKNSFHESFKGFGDLNDFNESSEFTDFNEFTDFDEPLEKQSSTLEAFLQSNSSMFRQI